MYLVPGPMFSFSETIRSSGKTISTSVAWDPLFSIFSVTWPDGTVLVEVSHLESAAVTWIASPFFASLFWVQPVTAARVAAAAAAVTTESRTARIQAPREVGQAARQDPFGMVRLA